MMISVIILGEVTLAILSIFRKEKILRPSVQSIWKMETSNVKHYLPEKI